MERVIDGNKYAYLVRDAEGRYKRPLKQFCDTTDKKLAQRYVDYQSACNMAKLMNVQIEIEVL